MKVVILCGGQGTRIRDASETLPKPMLPIGGKPIIWHIMKGYSQHGFNDFVLCLGYKGWAIKEFFLNYRAMLTDITVSLGEHSDFRCHGNHSEEHWNVTLAETGEETMTGARITRIKRYVEKEDLFLLTYGDGVADVNITELVAFHRAHGRIATVTTVRPTSRFGELTTDGLMVTEFSEKPQTSEGLINGGFFVCDARRIWPYLEGGSDLVFEKQPLQRLAADGELAGYHHRGFWQPMDTAREYALLNQLWASGQAPWQVWPPNASDGSLNAERI